MNVITPKTLICCVAGKSGGHILPCLQFAKTHFESNTELIFISTTASLDKKIISSFELNDHLALYLPPIPYKAFWRLPFFCISTIRACIQSLWYLKKHNPSRIVSTGGFISLPVCFAAWILQIPIDLFELNAVPGKATLLISKLATNIFICFEESKTFFKAKCILANYPIRFSEQDTLISSEIARTKLGFSPLKQTILILGGSQGSEFLNTVIQKIPNTFLSNYTIIHQTGQAQISDCSTFYTTHGIEARVFGYESNIASYYQAADLVICRAGAGTLFETVFFKKPCIIIPLETNTTDHQLNNAYAIQKAHTETMIVLRQKDIVTNPILFFTSIQKVLATQVKVQN